LLPPPLSSLATPSNFIPFLSTLPHL
jgi:hypothetical protein